MKFTAREITLIVLLLLGYVIGVPLGAALLGYLGQQLWNHVYHP